MKWRKEPSLGDRLPSEELYQLLRRHSPSDDNMVRTKETSSFLWRPNHARGSSQLCKRDVFYFFNPNAGYVRSTRL